MKVLFFSRAYTTHDYRFLSALSGAGIDCCFLPLQLSSNSYESRSLPDGVRTVPWKERELHPGDFDALRACRHEFETILQCERPDLVHAGPVQSCGYMAALSGFSPLVVMSWGSDVLLDAARDANWRSVTEFTLSRATGFVCDCNAVLTLARPMLTCTDKAIAQFPWGVDLTMYAPAKEPSTLRARMGWRDSVVLISTRSWEPIYGIDVLLRAFVVAHDREPRLKLMLLGSGSQAAMIQSFICNHRLQHVVLHPGVISQDELPEYFRTADAYVSCCRSDGTSVSLLEGMATGLPVVVADIPGNREWVRAGENGWLVASDDTEGFAYAMLQVACNAEERYAIGLRNRQLTEHRADWKRNIGRLLELYGRLTGQPLGSGSKAAPGASLCYTRPAEQVQS